MHCYEQTLYNRFRPYSQNKKYQSDWLTQNAQYHYQYQKRSENMSISKQKRVLSSQSLNLSRYSGELIRSQSANKIYKNNKIQLLTKMNHMLNNRTQHQGAYENNNKFQNTFRDQINRKLDRLEKYLSKIKSQRQRQYKPIVKQKQKRNIKIDNSFNKQTSINQNFIQKIQKKPNVQDALKELQKIKNQLIQRRCKALLVKQRNSLQKPKFHNLNLTNRQYSGKNNGLVNFPGQLKQKISSASDFIPHFQDIYRDNRLIETNNYEDRGKYVDKRTISVNNVNQFARPKITFSFNQRF